MWFAVACAALLAPLAQERPARPPQSAIDSAIERGAEFLRESILRGSGKRPGDLEGAKTGVVAGERALLAYTLLKAGADHDDALVQRLVAALAYEPIERTYDVGCTLLLLELQDARAHRAWIDELARRLLEWQGEYGWGYPGGNDLSNTQYAALGLWAAARAGFEVPAEVWRRLAGAVSEYGTRDGGFTYTSGAHGGATGSMSAAGVGTLALCELELARAGVLDEEWGWIMRRSRAAGLAWLARELRVDTNPHGGAWTYYWLYGLERMAAFCGLGLLGERDWYGEGAGWLVATQAKDGSWGDRVQTCFAVLFLARAALSSFAPSTGLEVGGECRSEPGAAVRFDARADGERVALRLLGILRPVAQPLEWPGEARRGPRVLRVEYLSDGELVAVALGDFERASRGNSFPATVRLARGVHELSVRVHALVPPDGPGGQDAPDGEPRVLVLESPPVRCDLDRLGKLPGSPGDPASNLLRAAGTHIKVSASTTLREFDDLPGLAFDAAQACDGLRRRPWIARERDEEASLTIELRKPVRANRITLVPACLPGYPSDELGRVLEVELTLNGKLVLRVPMPPDPSQVARVDLEQPLELKRLELRLLGRVPGRRGALVGLGEVELALLGEE